MGTNDRKKSGKIFTGSRLIVDGQGNSGVLKNKIGRFADILKTVNDGPGPALTPTPSITPSVTPTPSITPSITPTPSITSSNITTNTPTPTNTLTPTPTPSITPTISITPSFTPTVTPTITPTGTQSVAVINIQVAYDAALPPMSGTVWYAISPTPESTLPVPTGLTWVQLNTVLELTSCDSYTNFGPVSSPVGQYVYFEVRDVSSTNAYECGAAFSDPCIFTVPTQYSVGIFISSAIVTNYKLKVKNPISTVPV